MEESCVCWNSEDTGATELYAKGGDTTICQSRPPQQKKESSTSTSASPPPMLTIPSVSNDECNLLFTPATQRKLNRSKDFKAHELVHVLYTALLHAARATYAKSEHIYRLDPKCTYKFPNVLRFTAAAKDYTWGSLAVRVGTTTESRAHESKRNIRSAKNTIRLDDHDEYAYYLIGRLGHGATSNVWHALDWKGNEVVIKMYVKTTNAKGLELDADGFEAAAEYATTKEVENFTTIYKFFGEKVCHMKLSDFHCVVMPFFKPVPTSEREDALEKVRVVLEENFTPAKLKYHDGDVRWSHVGTYYDEHTQTTRHILYDLADLVSTEDDNELSTEDVDEASTGDDNEPFVQDHLDILRRRIKGEQEAAVSEHFECHQVLSNNEETSCEFAT
eukprot:scaffold47928_cov56-Attheya_sp.AAC.5